MSEALEAAARAVPDAVVERLSRARCVLALTHENPDADTLGASLGVQRLVGAFGGSVTLVSSDPVPRLYDFLPGIDEFRSDPDPDAGYDLLVASDFGTPDRMGSVRERHAALLERLPRVMIDHHVSSQSAGPADWIDSAAAATCEMVALLAVRLGVPLTAGDGALATVLMAGIVMDTATFAHPNTTPRTLSVASALVEAGAPLSDISRRLYRSKPEAQLRLFGRVLERLESVDDGRVAWSTLLEADLVATGAEPSYSEGIIDLLAQAENAEVAILFKEADGQTRLSVRTRPEGVDAAMLTGQFGGGGHARAAGATLDLPVAQAREAVLREARRVAAQVRR
ncbi:MAG: bifunctional oligoribonuclease/PAP phosphatase NrnA [Chloroflexi bacterium]|nr:MAG: bifunctional oligoribonuclease/PAP phosphatase NrnA [Chloroflexota bacterium]